ncbi:hypothetical protein [Candidatus Poriferisodalis sp.]|uniref:hypothetical protein n=1 Tax=Candidatus Poriferisodalis sp. TaxID=3101277 RepID=UPI003B0238F1
MRLAAGMAAGVAAMGMLTRLAVHISAGMTAGVTAMGMLRRLTAMGVGHGHVAAVVRLA